MNHEYERFKRGGHHKLMLVLKEDPYSEALNYLGDSDIKCVSPILIPRPAG